MRFKDKSVLITGAGSGFGRLAAQCFAVEGAKLTVQDINEAGLAETVETVRGQGGAIASLIGDVSEAAHLQALVALAESSYGCLDIALNNAGVGNGVCAILDTTMEAYDRTMAVNARGVFAGMKFQIPAMINAGGGAILNVASAAGLVGSGHLAAYAASKHAVIGMTKAAADECARHNIRVNAICPSFAATPMVARMAENMMGQRQIAQDEAYKRIAKRIPMRRVGQPEEVVQAILWILSPENSYMTGQAVAVDGGLTAI